MAITPGEKLRLKREEMKLSLEQVAEGTSIRIHFLQAIEEDRLGAISSQTQLRGFIRLYASYLGLTVQDLESSAEPVLEKSGEEDESGKQRKGAYSQNVDSSASKKAENDEKLARSDTNKEKSESIPEKQSTLIFKEIGSDLQKQREALGLSRSDIERQIKIRELYVYALENGLIDDLPSSVQGRGMLNNYSAFMNLDPEPIQLRFAEGLQQRRIEKSAEEIAKKKSPELKKYNAPITGWRRYATPDLIIGGAVFIVLFILIIWGALQVIGSTKAQIQPTAESISNILISTDTPQIPTVISTPEVTITGTLPAGEIANTASVDMKATINAVGNYPIQIVVVAYQRTYLKIVCDGKDKFVGRVVPGTAYPFSASSRIQLTTGNAAAIQIYFNQQDLGILGSNGQVLNLDFSSDTMITSTPQFTAIPTSTMVPTNTQLPTATPTVTSTPEVPTITPYRP